MIPNIAPCLLPDAETECYHLSETRKEYKPLPIKVFFYLPSGINCEYPSMVMFSPALTP